MTPRRSNSSGTLPYLNDLIISLGIFLVSAEAAINCNRKPAQITSLAA